MDAFIYMHEKFSISRSNHSPIPLFLSKYSATIIVECRVPLGTIGLPNGKTGPGTFAALPKCYPPSFFYQNACDMKKNT
jgi:hypothetical protein